MTEESTRRSVRVRDLNISYHEAGNGPETAILLHGAGPGASAWGNFHQQFGPYAERYRTLLIDMPHYGNSDRPADHRNDTVFYTSVLLDVMDALKVDRAHLVGNSMGGVMALRVALDAPERAGRLVLLGPAGSLPLFTPGPTYGQQLLRGYYQPPGPSIEKMKAWMSVIVHDQALVTDELVAERYAASIANRPTSPPAPNAMIPIWHEVARVKHKTLIIWGKEDRVVPMDAAFVLSRLMPNADLHIFGATGHWVQNERPADFNAVTLTFFSMPLAETMSFIVAVDIGGTFTDLVAFDKASHRVLYTKSPTTYKNFADGILDCFGKVRLSPNEAALVNHGTTLVINAIVQRNGARTALITTAGFRDVLEIARGNRPDPFDLHYRRDEPLVPRELRFEVRERMDARGNAVEPLDVDELTGLAARLRELGIEAVAVFFMHSFANPRHELAAVDVLRRELPGVFVTHSTDLTREWYEYERTSTVAANAYVGPSVSSYIRRLQDDLRDDGFIGGLYMMGSNGGVLSTDRTCRQPIALVESGPVGGCIGVGAYANALGYGNVIAFDMGGTTAKCALVEDGRFSVDSVYYAAGYKYGFPVKSPVVDIVEVGSGGGSIAWLDGQKRLHVGPQSAGSTPGPVCYGRGGTEPTVTDANLLLGRINADHFLGGELKLDTAAAREAVERRIAGPLGYPDGDGAVRIADGILSIATVVMAGALRRISVEHGRDPRDFALFAYGGGGPLHASALARELAIPTIVIPPEPGTFSATGMLLADARLDDAVTFARPLEEPTLPELEAAFQTMETAMANALTAEFAATEHRFERFAEMRYRGQRHNIKVPIARSDDGATIRSAFERDYLRRYGHADPNTASEFQALHLSGFARLDRPDIARLPRPAGKSSQPHTRPVYFGDAAAMLDTMVYDRYALAPGSTGVGPALLEEYGSTTLVWPGDRFTIGELHEIRIDCDVERNAP